MKPSLKNCTRSRSSRCLGFREDSSVSTTIVKFQDNAFTKFSQNPVIRN